MEKSQELREVLLRYLDADLERIIFSNPRTRESYLKLTVRPLLLRGGACFSDGRIYGKTGISEKSERRKDRRVSARRAGKPLPQCGDRVASRDCQYSDQ